MNQHPIRAFTDKGLAEFTAYVIGSKFQMPSPPTHLLFNDEFALPVPASGIVVQRHFEKKFDLGMEICRAAGRDNVRVLLNEPNVWPWLSLYFHESTMPKKVEGWFIGASSRHLVERIHGRSQDQSHRHLVKGAATNCYRFGSFARVLMDKADGQSKIEEQVMSRRADLGIAVHTEFVHALFDLYWDKVLEQLKRGARGDGAGSITHLIDLLGQFDFTYDIRSMTADQIVAILPARHFNRFFAEREKRTGRTALQTEGSTVQTETTG